MPLCHTLARVYNRTMLHLRLEDDQYPFSGVTHVRDVARGIVLDEQGRVAIHVIRRDDMFCNQRYLETPGGGVDEGESFETALIRECQEELGYEVEILAYIGEVDDFYNLIGRENHNRYYLAKRKNYVGVHWVSSGDSLIQETLYLPLDEAIAAYEKQDDTLVAGLVKRRELPILYAAKELINSENL